MAESDDEPNRTSGYKRPFLNTLFSALQELEGSVTTIELINETKVKGHILHVSTRMDITVADAVVSRDITGRSKSNFGVEIMFIRRNRIRFIHFPDSFNIIMKIQENVRNVKRL